MEKLILILIVFALMDCGSNNEEHNNQCYKFRDIALKAIPKYLESLDTVALSVNNIIEFGITEEDDYFVGDLFLSGPYVSGQKVPSIYQKVNQPKGEVHLLVYCNNNNISQKDSIETIKELSKEGLVVANALEWTLSGQWSTQDYERLKFIFCKDEIEKYTLNNRFQDVEKNLVFPNCSN